MLKVKKVLFSLLFIISVMITFSNILVTVNAAKTADLRIVLIAWPLVAGWFLFVAVFVFLAVFSWKKIKKTQQETVSYQ